MKTDKAYSVIHDEMKTAFTLKRKTVKIILLYTRFMLVWGSTFILKGEWNYMLRAIFANTLLFTLILRFTCVIIPNAMHPFRFNVLKLISLDGF